MITTDMSFNNLAIAGFFKGSNKYTPTAELMYVHSHPLLTPNFLIEIEVIINLTGELIKQKNITGPVIEKITKLSIALGADLPTINQENAPRILNTLRSIYMICVELLKRHNFVNEKIPGIGI